MNHKSLFGKSVIALALSLAMAMTTTAQVVNVASVKKIELPTGSLINTAAVSPNGQFIITTDLVHDGLSRLDLSTGKMRQLTKTGSGFDLKISADSKEVVYCDYTTDSDRLRWTSVKSLNLANNSTRTIVGKSRDIKGFSVAGNKVLISGTQKVTSSKLALSSTFSAPEVTVSIVNGQLCVGSGGVNKVISPQGKQGTSYIWPSLSPDGKQILYFLTGTQNSNGAYVCDLHGKNVKALGYLHAPVWLDNNIIVGMRDYDNGTQLTESTIIAKRIDNLHEQKLTPRGIIATYPSACSSKISFVTPRGELYVINLK